MDNATFDPSMGQPMESLSPECSESDSPKKGFQIPLNLETSIRQYGSILPYYSARVTVTNLHPADLIFYPGRDNENVLQFIGEQVTGFVNIGVPGNILFGVQRNGRVEGASVFHYQQDMIRTILGTMLQYEVTPVLPLDVVTVSFDPVAHCPPHARRPQGSARRVMNIKIHPVKRDHILTYFRGRAYIRELGEVHRLTDCDLRLFNHIVRAQEMQEDPALVEARGLLQCSRGLLSRFGFIE